MGQHSTATPDPTARELAQAMLEGLENRLALGPLPFARLSSSAVSSETRHALQEYADLTQLPALAKPGHVSGLIRMARRVLRRFLMPWFAVQTQFNQETLRWLEGLTTEIAVIKKRLESSGHSKSPIAPELQPPISANMSNSLADHQIGLDALLSIFLHTRLPAPPARLIDLNGSLSADVGLRAFGYRIDTWNAMNFAGDSGAGVRHESHLHLSNAAYEAAVCVPSTSAREDSAPNAALPVSTIMGVHRLLTPRGVFILALPSETDHSHSPLPTVLHSLWSLFRLREVVEATNGPSGWTLSPRAPVLKEAADIGASSWLLIVAEKS